jgi:hypothetical protein
MSRSLTLSTLTSSAVAASLFLAAASADAQAPPLSESIAIGEWMFRPSVEIRVRGEGRTGLFTQGGMNLAVLADGFGESTPSNAGAPIPGTIWGLSERSRLGMAVDRGPVTANLVLQDARVLGDVDGYSPMRSSVGLGGLGGLTASSYGLSIREAYVDVHSRSGRPMFLRVGRQKVVWGDGRLLGESDWAPVPRAIDAARLGLQLGDFDVELMGALLTPPFSQLVAAKPTDTSSKLKSFTGTQLYGLNVKWHLLPLFNPELTALSRIVRIPGDTGKTSLGGLLTPTRGDLDVPLTPGDTYVIDARFSGDQRGFHYAVEGAYELGRVASYGANRDIGAFAAAARASLETALPGHLTFGAQGAYASGDEGVPSPATTLKRFDPILPDAFANHGRMGLYAWSNIIEGGGDVKITPLEELSITAGYRFAALASPKGRWTTAELSAVGAESANTSRTLGHEIDASITVTPWDPIELQAGYSLFLFGGKAKSILSSAGQTGSMQHWAYLQAVVHAP